MNTVGDLMDTRRLRIVSIEPGNLDLFGEADLLQHPDAIVVDIKLIPRQPVACGDRVGVVVVVPTFATCEKGDPPVVVGIVSGFKATPAPHVSCRVDQPCSVQAERGPEKYTPEKKTQTSMPAAEESPSTEQDGSGSGERYPVILTQPNVNGVACEVGSVALENRCFGMQGLSGQDPTDMCPPGAVVRAVRITLVI